MKKLLSLLAIVALMFTIIACASNGDTPADTSNDTVDATAEDAEPITLQYLSATLIERPDGDVEQEVIDSFLEKNPHVTFDISTVSSNELMPAIMTRVVAGDAPDIFTLFMQYMVTLNDMDALLPLNDIMGQDYVNDVAMAVRGEVMLGDTLFIAPWGSIPTGFVYRSDIFEELGLTPPTTFDEVTELGLQLTTGDQFFLALIASNNSSGASRFIPMLRNSGVRELIYENGEFSTEINSPGAIAALDYYYRWANVYNITPPGAGEVDHAAAINLLATEVAIATFTGPHTVGSVVAMNPELEGKFAGAPMPTLSPGANSLATGNVNGFAISAASEHTDIAAAYLAYLTSPANFELYNAATNRVPPFVSQVTDSVSGNALTAGFIPALNNAFEVQLTEHDGDVRDVLAWALNAMASGARSDAAGVAAEAEADILRIFGR